MLRHLIKSLSLMLIINEISTSVGDTSGSPINDAEFDEPRLGPRLAQPNVFGVILNKYRKAEATSEPYYEIVRDDDKSGKREKRKTTTTTTERHFHAYIQRTTLADKEGKVKRAMLSHLNGTVIIPVPYVDVLIEMHTLFFLAASIVFAMRCCCIKAQC